MPVEPWQALNPDNGSLYLAFERPFRYLVEDHTRPHRIAWIPTVLDCPICGATEGLRIAHQIGEDLVPQATCPAGHIWVEARVLLDHWETYCRLEAGQTVPDSQWLLDAGFGQEPPPPVDVAGDLAEAAKYTAGLVKSHAKKKVRATGRKAKRAAVRQAMRPVAAGIRAAWAWQAGGVEPVKAPKRQQRAKPPTPPRLADYRRAAPSHFGTTMPRGPKCLVCEDTGRITGPGISTPCTDC